MVVLIVEYGPKPCSNYSGPYVRARTRVGTAVCCGFSNWGFGVLKLRLHSLLLSGCWALKDPGSDLAELPAFSPRIRAQ